MPVLGALGGASIRGFGNQIGSRFAAPGQAEFTSPGRYTWTAPQGVDAVSVVCVGGGGGSAANEAGGGGGGGLAWKNNIRVIPGASYVIDVGAGGLNSGQGVKGGKGGDSSAFGVIAFGGRGTGDPRPGYGGQGGGFANADGGGIGGNGGNGNLRSISDSGRNQGGGGAGGYGGVLLFDLSTTPYTIAGEIQVGVYTNFGNGRLPAPEFGTVIAAFGYPKSTTAATRTISTNDRVILTSVNKLYFKVNAATSATWGDPPDGNSEALHLEYSTNGSTWSNIRTVNPSEVPNGLWYGIDVDVPSGAKVSGGVFLRYRQSKSSATDIPRDVWGMTSIAISGQGGRGAAHNTNDQTAGSGGAGGGGANGGPGETGGGGGGGVGIFGLGADGAAGTPGSTSSGGGRGGSGGQDGQSNSLSARRGGNGGNFGGGAGSDDGAGGVGGSGAVRIIWAGSSGIPRLFPSTNTGNI